MDSGYSCVGGWDKGGETFQAEKRTWYARGKSNKYSRKETFTIFGSMENWKNRGGNELRSGLLTPMNARLCSLLFIVTPKENSNKGGGLLRLQQAGNKAKAETALGW